MTKLNRKCFYAIFSIIAIVAILFGFAPRITFASAATQDEYSGYFSGGDGSENNPYLISNEAELGHIDDTRKIDEDGYYNIDKSFKLVNDIRLTKSWTPIEGYFRGTFDGNNKTISNMHIKAEIVYSENSNERDYGFMRSLEYGTIKNLNFDACEITCNDTEHYFNIGVIVGSNHGYIVNCNVTNTTIMTENAWSSSVGGICGYSFAGTVTNCKNYANITGSGNIGGIVGSSYSVKIEDCENYGEINYKFYEKSGCAAGIIGKTESNSRIIHCANHGKIVYGSKKNLFNSNIRPCMAQIIGWRISGTFTDCTIISKDDINYKNLTNAQKQYCSEEYVGRSGQ